MKIIKTVEIFNDMDVKVNIGDSAIIETSKGHYEGIIKNIKPNCLGLILYGGSSLTIAYTNILKFK